MSTNLTSVLLAVVAGVFLLPVGLHGDEKVDVRFLSFPKAAEPGRFELLVDGNDKISIELPTNNLSPEYTVDRVEEWTMEMAVVDDKGKPAIKVQGRTPVLDAKSQLVLVLRQGLEGADGLKLIALDIGNDGLGGGKYLFVNTTDTSVGGSAGDTDFALEPESHKMLAPEPSKVKGSRKYLYTKLHYVEGEEQKDFYSSTWRFSENARNIVIFYKEPGNDQIRIHTVRNYLR